MGWCFVTLTIGALASLAAARYLSGPIWVDFLWLCFGLAAAALGALLGIILRRISEERWRSFAGLLMALAAVVGRGVVLAMLLTAPTRQVTIEASKMALAAGTVAWGALGLLWGIMGISHALERPAGVPLPKLDLLAGALAVTLALFSVAPLWRLLGLEINLVTALGLFALALATYGLSWGYAVWRRRVNRADS